MLHDIWNTHGKEILKISQPKDAHSNHKAKDKQRE